MFQAQNVPELSFIPNFKSVNKKSLKILKIEGLTGLMDIESAFDNPLNNTDVELIVSFLNRKFDFSTCNNVYFFIINVIGFSPRSLETINANYDEFYDNMLLDEALEIILTKLITNDDIPSINGFPSDFNISLNQTNRVNVYNGKKLFPYKKERSELNYDQLLLNVLHDVNVGNNSKILFHGCAWDSAISIMDKIEIFPRRHCTDFGLRNFYLTDTFQTACLWATRNRQAAVVIFVLPEYYINNLSNHLLLNNFEQWKELVFKIRNPIRYGPNLTRERNEYKLFIQNIDSNDLVSGPIFANPYVKTIEDVNLIKYGNYIPYQYSFKDSSIDSLNNMLAITLFFESENE